MGNEMKQATLKGIVDAEIVELMTKTTGDQVYLDENTTVSSKIEEMSIAIKDKSTVHICKGQPENMRSGDLYFITSK